MSIASPSHSFHTRDPTTPNSTNLPHGLTSRKYPT